MKKPTTLRTMLTLTGYRRNVFLISTAFWLLLHSTPVLFGIFDRALFDSLAEGPEGGGVNPFLILLLMGLLDTGRIGLLAGGVITWSRYFIGAHLLIRRNLLGWLLTAKGARRLNGSPSEVVTRFRDDVDDVGNYLDSFADFPGFALFAVLALVVMLGVDVQMTVLIMAPLGLSVLLARVLQPLIRATRRRLREATTEVTGFIGELMGAVQAIKIAGATEGAMRHFDGLGEVRRRAALKDSLLTESFRSVSDNMVAVSTAIMLFLAAVRMREGVFTVGDMALFMSYLPYLTGIMTFIGNMLVEHRRAGVAFERLDGVAVDAPPLELVRNRDLQLDGPLPDIVNGMPERVPLQRLDVRGLGYTFPDGTEAISDVSFTLPRGTLTVVTGRVGSGKSTMLRALLGLLPQTTGEVLWNLQPISDRSTFLVPPNAAYTAQVPRLFSDSLRENLVLGRTLGRGALDRAIDTAVMRHDIERLEEGLDTGVGNRGVKLSGGQIQRSAAARMFVGDAELLVFDDLSSALDAQTEAELWRALQQEDPGRTYLVVSHRPVLLERADQVLVMEAGRILT